MFHGYLRDIKEKVFVEEENLQDYQKRREEEKVRNGKLDTENLLRKLQMWLERKSCGCLRNGVVKDGKRRQSNPKQWKGLVRRLSLPDIF